MITTAEFLLGWLVTISRNGMQECLMHSNYSDSYGPNPGPCPPAVFAQIIGTPLAALTCENGAWYGSLEAETYRLECYCSSPSSGLGMSDCFVSCQQHQTHTKLYIYVCMYVCMYIYIYNLYIYIYILIIEFLHPYIRYGNRCAITKLSIPNATSWDDFPSLGIGEARH